jgi:streptogramin lyase
MRTRMLAVALLLLSSLAIAVSSGRAGAAVPGEATTFAISRACFEGGLAAAPRGGVLVGLCGGSPGQPRATIGSLRPSGSRTTLATVESRGGPILAGEAGEVWAAGLAGGSTVTVDRIGADGSVQTFPVGSETDPTSEVFVRGLATGGEGALWVATGAQKDLGNAHESLGGELVRIGPDGAIASFPLPERIEPRGLASGPDGDAWFTADRGRFSLEGSLSDGVGYVGRMTPAGELSLFRIPGKDTGPEGIAAGPDGRLWFVETGQFSEGVATIGVDGKFGPRFPSRVGELGGALPKDARQGLAFGPEGDAWVPTYGGLLRLTPAGQQTLFREAIGGAVAVGREGDPWVLEGNSLVHLVAGAPGIDAQRMHADRHLRGLHIKLACGGSTTPCAGRLKVILKIPRYYRRAHPRQKRNLLLGDRAYRVPANAVGRVTVKLSAPVRAFLRTFHPSYLVTGPTVVLRGTVTGGPPLKLRTEVASLLRP